MNSFFSKILKGDMTLWIVFLALCAVSAIEMYSASSTLAYKAANYSMPMLRHVRFLAIGMLVAYGIHFIPYKYIRILSYLGLFVSLILLVLVQFKGVSENDATRWFEIFGIRFQPSEIAKLSLIIVVADFISRIKDNNKEDEKTYFWWIMGSTAVICFLILLENFSTALLLFLIVALMLFIGRVSLKRLGIIVGGLAVVAVLGYFIVKATPADSMPEMFKRSHTWVARIDRFFDSNEDSEKYVITDETRQQKRASIAIARGGVFGVFPGNSVERDYLPQAYSDFIYAIIVEEMGLLGGIFVILLYLILLFRAGQIATKCGSVFPALLVIGLSLMIVVQAFVSMSVATGLGPVTGQPLPLISRGGTSIVLNCVYFGIILGVTRQIKEELSKQKNIENEIPVVDLDEL